MKTSSIRRFPLILDTLGSSTAPMWLNDYVWRGELFFPDGLISTSRERKHIHKISPASSLGLYIASSVFFQRETHERKGTLFKCLVVLALEH